MVKLLVLNGDHFEFAPHMPAFRKLAEATQERIDANATRQPAVEDWHTWWERLAREPGMSQLFAERERRFIDRSHTGEHILAELHEAALRDAGFREVGVIWQHMDNRVVLGVR